MIIIVSTNLCIMVKPGGTGTPMNTYLEDNVLSFSVLYIKLILLGHKYHNEYNKIII